MARPSPGDLDLLVATLARRTHRLLVRRRVLVEGAEWDGCDPGVDDEPVLAGLASASVQGRVALGSRAGAAIRRCGALPDEAPLPPVRGSCHAAVGGFDLDATVQVPVGARAHLERVCRYALRPAIAQDRIRMTAEGDVLLELRHRWSDGTTGHLGLPAEVPPPRPARAPPPRSS